MTGLPVARLAGGAQALQQALLDGRDLDVGLVAAFTLEGGGDAADHDPGVHVAELLRESLDIGQGALAELGAEHGERGVALDVFDLHVIGLAFLDRDFLVFDGPAAAEAEAAAATGGSPLLVLHELAVHEELVAVVTGDDILEHAGVGGGPLARGAGAELVRVHTVGEAVTAEGAEIHRVVVVGSGRFPLELLVVVELDKHSFALVELAHVVDGVVLVHELAGLVIHHFRVREGVADAGEDGELVVVGRGAAVVAVHQVHVVGVRAHDGDALDVLGERQDAVVLEEDHAFTRGLDGQLVVLLAGDHLRLEVLPRGHLVRVEHAQLEAAAEDWDEGVVEVVDGDQALLEGVAEVAEGTAALEVGAVLEGVGGGVHGILVGHVLAAVEVVVDGVAVGDHQAVIAPLVAEDVHEQAVAHRARNALVALVRAHHFADVTLDHQGLEGGEVGLPEVAHRHGHVHAVAERFRTAVHGVVLGAGVGLIVLAGLLLHAQDGLEADDRGQVRVLARGLLAASPARVAEDVDVRAPEGQLRVAGIVPGLVVHVPFPLGTVPVGARLVGDGGIDLIDLLRVEGGGHADGLRIHGVAVGADAVAGLAPPVVGSRPIFSSGVRSVRRFSIRFSIFRDGSWNGYLYVVLGPQAVRQTTAVKRVRKSFFIITL